MYRRTYDFLIYIWSYLINTRATKRKQLHNNGPRSPTSPGIDVEFHKSMPIVFTGHHSRRYDQLLMGCSFQQNCTSANTLTVLVAWLFRFPNILPNVTGRIGSISSDTSLTSLGNYTHHFKEMENNSLPAFSVRSRAQK